MKERNHKNKSYTEAGHLFFHVEENNIWKKDAEEKGNQEGKCTQAVYKET